jgi:flavin reductase (DIM6/NTAB) family NADH-FMN oxidoreductase RutF
MDPNDKKAVLRMIPYGLYVLTAGAEDGRVAAATVNWVTQVAFAPPLVVVGVKTDSHTHGLIKETKGFAINFLRKGQQALAYTFFKPVTRDGNSISGEAFRIGETGSPLLHSTPSFVECKLIDTVERGDHSVFLGEVIAAGPGQAPAGRPDDETLTLKDLGEKVFYGG